LNCYGGSKAVPKERDKEPRESQETGMKGKRERERERERKRERWIERKGEARGTGKYVSNAVETFY